MGKRKLYNRFEAKTYQYICSIFFHYQDLDSLWQQTKSITQDCDLLLCDTLYKVICQTQDIKLKCHISHISWANYFFGKIMVQFTANISAVKNTLFLCILNSHVLWLSFLHRKSACRYPLYYLWITVKKCIYYTRFDVIFTSK